MPHAIFIETDVDGQGLVGAYAAELPGCAVFAPTDNEAASAMPMRVGRFTAWLKANGEPVQSFVGDNWYEVERAAATGERRAAFTLDDLPPSDEEFATWLRWLELAREELAAGLDAADPSTAAPLLDAIERQDMTFVRDLEHAAPELSSDPVDRLYAAREALTDALEAAGPYHDGVRRMLRLAIADDLRAADALRAGE
jgi:hypothetical protein